MRRFDELVSLDRPCQLAGLLPRPRLSALIRRLPRKVRRRRMGAPVPVYEEDVLVLSDEDLTRISDVTPWVNH